MTTGRFYVKGSKIRNKITNEFYTVDEICYILNNYDNLLTECEKEFRKYDGRKLFDTSNLSFAGILNKISEVLDPK